MNADPKRVIVTESCCHACSVRTTIVHHESFPEMRAEGMDAAMAAEHLANRLAASIDSMSDPASRAAIGSALADTRAFLDRAGPVHLGRAATGVCHP